MRQPSAGDVDTILREAERAIGRRVTAEQRMAFSCMAHVVTATKP
jgi:hypothetical protein